MRHPLHPTPPLRRQNLLLTLGGASSSINYGAVTAVALSHDGSRLMSGYEQGQVVRWDMDSGKILNTIADAHTTPILTVAFTDDRKLAVTHDAAGRIFTHGFKRVMGMRVADSNCVYMADHPAELACCVHVLRYDDRPQLSDSIVLAIGTFKKIILLQLRPQLRGIYTINAPSGNKNAPTFDWSVHYQGISFLGHSYLFQLLLPLP